MRLLLGLGLRLAFAPGAVGVGLYVVGALGFGLWLFFLFGLLDGRFGCFGDRGGSSDGGSFGVLLLDDGSVGGFGVGVPGVDFEGFDGPVCFVEGAGVVADEVLACGCAGGALGCLGPDL